MRSSLDDDEGQGAEVSTDVRGPGRRARSAGSGPRHGRLGRQPQQHRRSTGHLREQVRIGVVHVRVSRYRANFGVGKIFYQVPHAVGLDEALKVIVAP